MGTTNTSPTEAKPQIISPSRRITIKSTLRRKPSTLKFRSLAREMQDAEEEEKKKKEMQEETPSQTTHNESGSDSDPDSSCTGSDTSVNSLNTSTTATDTSIDSLNESTATNANVNNAMSTPTVKRSNSIDFEIDGEKTVTRKLAGRFEEIQREWKATHPEITSPKSPMASTTKKTPEEQALELIQKALNNYNWSNEVDFSRKKDSYGYIPKNVSEMRGKKTLTEIIAQAKKAIKPSCFSCFCLFSKRKQNTLKFYEILAELKPNTLNEQGLKQLEENLLNTLPITKGQSKQNTDWREGKVLPEKKYLQQQKALKK